MRMIEVLTVMKIQKVTMQPMTTLDVNVIKTASVKDFDNFMQQFYRMKRSKLEKE